MRRIRCDLLGEQTTGSISDMNHSEIVSFIWAVADLIRNVSKRGKTALWCICTGHGVGAE